MKPGIVLAVIAIAALALVTSCGDDSVTGTEPEYSRATPQDLIEALAYSMEEKDTDIYDECLHDEYLFEFTSKDAEDMGLPPTEPWWGKAEDVQCMNSMFTDPTVKEIECHLPVVTGPLSSEDTLNYRVEISLKVPVFEEGETEGYMMWANHSWLDVEIVADPDEDGKWVFGRIEEVWKPYASAPGLRGAAEYASFGSIKALFRVEDF
jgi:hypothetical protein